MLIPNPSTDRGFNKSHILEVTEDTSSSPGEAAEAGTTLMEIGRRATLGSTP